MIRTINLGVDKPVIPDDSDLEHKATSWEVSLIPNFSDNDTLIVKQDKDEDNLLNYKFTYDLGEDQPLYIRTKYHFKKGDDEYESNWSKIIPLNVRDTGIKMSSVMIVTPKVTVRPVYDDVITGELEITTSDYLLYAGTGSHKATTYVIETLNGEEVYRREYDEDNLTSLKIDLSILDKNKIYVVKVKHHSLTNAESNYGKAILKLTSELNNLYELKRISDLKPYRDLFFKLNLLGIEVKSVDIIIRDINSNIVASIYDVDDNIIKLPVGNIKTDRYYDIYSRITYSDGKKSEFILLETVYCVPNYLVNLNPVIGYRDTISLVREFNTNSLVVNYTYELTNGNILFMKHNDGNVYLYKMPKTTDIEYNRTILKLGDNFKTKSYFHARELPSGKVLLDVVDGNLTPYFILLDYNPVTDTFKEIFRIKRTDERFNTSVSGSLVAYEDDKILYIPARQLDSNGKYTKLYIKSLDIENRTITKFMDISNKINAVAFINMFSHKDDIYLFGGSNEYTLDDNKERIFERKSDKLFRLDVNNKVINDIGSVSDTLPKKVYCLHPVVRKDGKILFFNNVYSGDYLGNQDVYLMDMRDKSISKITTDTTDILSYRNTMVSKFGNIFRVTSRVRDSQKLYLYEVTDGTDKDTKDDNSLDVIKNLVVPKYKTITIESPHRFETITVDGSDNDDTGVLRLIIDGVVKEVKYRDLLIYKDTHWEINLYEGDHDNWDNVYILDNAKFEINYFIDIPDDESLTIKEPFAVDHITLGENSELIIESED